jgi:hypothetical protein
VTERPESTGSIRIRVDEHITIEVDRPVGTERLTDILRAARAL